MQRTSINQNRVQLELRYTGYMEGDRRPDESFFDWLVRQPPGSVPSDQEVYSENAKICLDWIVSDRRYLSSRRGNPGAGPNMDDQYRRENGPAKASDPPGTEPNRFSKFVEDVRDSMTGTFSGGAGGQRSKLGGLGGGSVPRVRLGPGH